MQFRIMDTAKKRLLLMQECTTQLQVKWYKWEIIKMQETRPNPT